MHRSWPADPAQLSVIRRELAGWLAPLALTDDETAGVVLAVDEAAANAVPPRLRAGALRGGRADPVDRARHAVRRGRRPRPLGAAGRATPPSTAWPMAGAASR